MIKTELTIQELLAILDALTTRITWLDTYGDKHQELAALRSAREQIAAAIKKGGRG